MSDPTHIALLRDDPARFREEIKSGRLIPDLSNERVAFDFSLLNLGGANFRFCVLGGTKFNGATLNNCNFAGSDWAGCDFTKATLNGGMMGSIRNPDRALNLTTVTAHGFATGFESSIRFGNIWPDWDWERLGTLGRLPLFGVSTSALILIPAYFYLLAHYNHSLNVIKTSIEKSKSVAGPLADALDRLPPLPIPSLSLVTLASALLLATASLLYAFFCPQIPKQFSLAEWVHQLEKSPVTYLAQAWTRRWTRIVCAWFYIAGGCLGVFVLGFKLYQTAVYIISG